MQLIACEKAKYRQKYRHFPEGARFNQATKLELHQNIVWNFLNFLVKKAVRFCGKDVAVNG
jgi:hypothetical protein